MLMELLLKREQRISATEEEEVHGPVVYPVLAVPTDRWQGRLLAMLGSSVCGLLSTQTNVQLLLLLLLLLVHSVIKSLWMHDSVQRVLEVTKLTLNHHNLHTGNSASSHTGKRNKSDYPGIWFTQMS
jgi:hypothetical protein